jgi:hypothetical protein
MSQQHGYIPIPNGLFQNWARNFRGWPLSPERTRGTAPFGRQSLGAAGGGLFFVRSLFQFENAFEQIGLVGQRQWTGLPDRPLEGFIE